MAMRWFTREWLTGALSDEEWDRREAEYRAHLTRIEPMLTDGAELLLTQVNIHDASVVSWAHDPVAGTLSIRVILGDRQAGYEDVELTYCEVRLDAVTSVVLDELTQSPDAELLYDEVDITDQGRYEHRIIAAPAGELALLFGRLEVSRTPRLGP